MTPPPALLVRMLEAALPPGVVGRSIVGDLLEEWHRRAPGPRRTAWFTAVALALVVRYATARSAAWIVGAARAAGEALRRIPRDPLRTGVTVLALGIGIAAPATMYSIVAGLTAEIDVEEPEELVHIGRRFTPEVVGIARLDRLWPGITGIGALESVGVYAREGVDLAGGGGHAERLEAGLVTPGVFDAFGERPALGRTLHPGDATGEGSPVVLGWSVWRNRFAADRSIVGETVRLDGAPRAVVGVMPEGFAYPGGVDLWVPFDPGDATRADVPDYQAVGRLADGATIEGVKSRVEALNEALRRRGEEIDPAGGLAAERWRYHLISAGDRRMLSVLVLVVGFVLVIACADVLHLLLARALARSRETAVRVALGAGRARIVGEHLAEAAVLASLAGVVALALTVAGVRTFEARTAGRLAHWMDVGVDPPVLLVGAGMVALAALGAGLVPAIQSSRVDGGTALQEGGRGSTPFRIGRIGRGLVVAEIALSCALLVVAGVIIRGAVASLRIDGDFAASSVVVARYELRADAYDDAGARAFHRRLTEAIRGRPRVADAAVASHLPGIYAPRRTVEGEGEPAQRPEARPKTHVVSVSPSFLSTMESRVVRGRGLRRSDGVSEPGAVLVNEAFVREHLGGRDPLGAGIRLGEARDAAGIPPPRRRVVGVVPVLGFDAGGELDGAAVYLPAAEEPLRRAALMVRVAGGGDPLSVVPELRDVVAELDPDIALFEVDTLAGRIEEARALDSVFALLFLAFGLAGLLLAGVGLYGLLAFGVRRRVRELGVRIALGATPLGVIRAAVGAGALRLALGLALGLGLGALVAPVLGQTRLGGDPRDPLVYAVVAGVLGLTGLAAALKPARLALRLDVMEALRTE